MTELDDAALERLVSETMEPMPDPWPQRYDSESMSYVIRGDLVGRAWLSYNNGPWKPLRWLSDDNLNMRLFDEMADAIDLTTVRVVMRARHRRRAVVLAWLKWKGVKLQ